MTARIKHPPLKACPACNFSGPHCLCTRPNPQVVLSEPDYWWGRIRAASARSVEKRASNRLSSRIWREKQRIWDQRFRLADIAWLLHHGEWPAGYVEHIDGPSLEATNLRLHRLPAVLPKDRGRLPYVTLSGSSQWTTTVQWVAKTPPFWAAKGRTPGSSSMSLGTFLTPEEAYLAHRVVSDRLTGTIGHPDSVMWLG